MHGFSIMLVARGPQPEVIVKPPALVVEILSPDDTYTETQSRSADYLRMGVPCVWIIDPTSGQAASASETPGQPLKY